MMNIEDLWYKEWTNPKTGHKRLYVNGPKESVLFNLFVELDQQGNLLEASINGKDISSMSKVEYFSELFQKVYIRNNSLHLQPGAEYYLLPEMERKILNRVALLKKAASSD